MIMQLDFWSLAALWYFTALGIRYFLGASVLFTPVRVFVFYVAGRTNRLLMHFLRALFGCPTCSMFWIAAIIGNVFMHYGWPVSWFYSGILAMGITSLVQGFVDIDVGQVNADMELAQEYLTKHGIAWAVTAQEQANIDETLRLERMQVELNRAREREIVHHVHAFDASSGALIEEIVAVATGVHGKLNTSSPHVCDDATPQNPA
jgi:hypothetical protein